MILEASIVGGVVAIFTLWQLYPLYHAHRQSGRPAPDINALLDDRQRGLPRLLIYFWAPHCGMCKSTSPTIDQLMTERDDIIKVDVSQHTAIATAFGVLATPGIALIDHGRIEKLSLGPKTREQIIDLLAMNPVTRSS